MRIHNNRFFTLEFGAAAQPLREQCKKLGYVPNRKEAGALRTLQLDADGVTRLRLRGFLTEAESRKARARIFNAVAGAFGAKGKVVK